jgi:outer membrane protein OmpA-like peptidoglycan-associated protein
MRRFLASLTFGFFSWSAMAQMPADAPGAKDHPTLTRYAGSWLVAQELREFDAAAIPSGANAGQVANVEGRITRLYYLSPAGKSALEVQTNYESALVKAGATRIDACSAAACGARRSAFNSLSNRTGKTAAAGKFEGWSATSMLDQWFDDDSYRWWYGTLKSGGTTLHVSVLSARPGLIALSDKYVATVVQIVEPKAMETGMVTVDAGALARGLQAEGRIAVYGVYFDTGKSELKPESKAQLDEMAKLLKSNAAMRVYVVGHTDNQGGLDGNLALSKARAQAVVDALVKNYQVDAKRLAAAGVANYAPVASNAGDAGRARNRRVELVLQ